MKAPKWDLTNGYLIAEIFSWYYPQELQMHMYNNGTSLESKVKNWSLLRNFIRRHKLEIPDEYVEGTIHCKEKAAPLLVTRIYEILTNRRLESQTDESAVDFTDRDYQVTLPVHARSTASQAVKNNLRSTELMADRNIILGQEKAQTIIARHLDHRAQERLNDPQRFDRKSTLGELAPRRAPDQPVTSRGEEEELGDDTQDTHTKDAVLREPTQESISYKEVKVNQLDKTSSFNESVTSY